MENLVNKKVRHLRFGEGTIKEVLDDDKIIVEFNELEEDKKFKFPEVFEEFLSLEDEASQEDVMELLQERKEEIVREKEKIRLEFEEKYEEHRQQELELAKEKRKERSAIRKANKAETK